MELKFKGEAISFPFYSCGADGFCNLKLFFVKYQHFFCTAVYEMKCPNQVIDKRKTS